MRKTFRAGLGLILLVMVAYWSLGRSVRWHNRSESTSLQPAASRGQQAVRHRDAQSARSPVEIGASELQKKLLLRSLKAALESIQIEPDIVTQSKMLERLAQEIGEADLPAAIEFLNERNSSELNRALKLQLVRQWAGNDPRAAADWVIRAPMGSERQEAINDVAIVWANQSLSEAIEWVRQLPEEGERNGGLLSVAYEAARTEPSKALTLAMELPPGESRDDLFVHAATQLAAKSPEAALEWANQWTEGAGRERVYAGIATAWAERDPIAAATLALTSLSAGKQQDDALIGVVQRWVQKKPEAAAEWVAEFPPGILQDTALEELVKLWTDKNLEQTANWLNGLLPGPVRDVAAAAFVGKIARQFPELAARWAKDIGDEALRLRELEMVAEAWIGTNAAAARAWITQAALSEPVKIRLLALRAE